MRNSKVTKYCAEIRKQLLQMEFDQLRQRNVLKARLSEAKCMAAATPQKLKVS